MNNQDKTIEKYIIIEKEKRDIENKINDFIRDINDKQNKINGLENSLKRMGDL